MTIAARVGGVAALALSACAPADEAWVWDLPGHLAPPVVPEDRPLTQSRVELGRHLFYDERLSLGGRVSCGTCHEQALAFTDGHATSAGADGEHGSRSAMALANVAFLPTLTWGNPVLTTLEEQALVPLFLDVPIELGAQYVIDDALAEFERSDEDRERFVAAFPEDADPFTIDHVVAALAAFERTMISVDSPYDRWLEGDARALDESARRGLVLFESDRLGCAECHEGPLQTASVRDERTPDAISRFENTGLYDLGDDGSYPLPNTGLFEFTHDPADLGRHRVPSLRNVAVTAPYMHDGSIADLDGVIDHYAAGGRTISEGPYAGVGADNPHKSPLVAGFSATSSERADLIAFLEALTDESFLSDSRFADPATAD